eukprot:TRINITY_DN6425_c0_g1_i1.p1 TRINITY_DN6425_c0_g1~~TRINITY_DN6425_c0_g1_i1.p1  ORF type:complete len:195 (-),score=38.10 TRINITY_DN6425_c0_g1_i1:16-558(-)
MKKVYTTAVILAPPQEKWAPIQHIRHRHDKSFVRWMPHVNLAFPFLPYEQLEDGANKLKQALETFQSFEVTLAHVGHFEHSSNCVMWLRPDTDRPNALQDLENVITTVYPMCNDQSTKSEHGFTPHLTLGQFGKKNIEKDKANIQRTWIPITFRASSIYIIKRVGEEPFEIVHEVKFGVE